MTAAASPADTPADTPVDTRTAPSDSRRWQVLVVLCLALLVTGIDETIVNVALPTRVRQRRLGLARATLGLLADAGMSSLTYNAIAARSGVGTATLERYWTSPVDAVTDALAEIFRAQPVPQTGDLRRDLTEYVHELATVLSAARTRQILGALVAGAALDPELARALREPVVGPRRAEVAARLNVDAGKLRVSPDVATTSWWDPSSIGR